MSSYTGLMDAVEEIKQRLNIEDVIGQYVQLKRAGRNFKGLSPFSNEKTPSFMVSPEKQIWHDFSSNRGGNMFSFVMEMEGLDFKAALEMLARQAGVDLEQYRTSGNSYNQVLKNRVLEALDWATKFYQTQLVANKPAINYVIKQRQLTKATIITWRLGYAPNSGRALTDFLTKKGFTVEEMKRAGLAVQRAHGVGDMFRQRMMIPLCDSLGQVVGFTARLIEDDPNAPKYINTPQTIVYDKGRQVFGLHLAKEKIRKSGYSVVVEGNLDVITAHQAGTINVVATAGTAMTEMHLKALSRLSGDVRLCFDSDAAGLAATERAIPIAQKVGVQLSIINLGQAKDPDELIHKDVNMWLAALDNKQYALDWLIDQHRKLHNLDTAVGKRGFTDVVLPTLARLSDPVEQEHYLKKLASLTDSSIEAMQMKMKKNSGSTQTRLKKVEPQKVNLDPKVQERRMLEDHFLAIMLMLPAARHNLNDLQADMFLSEAAQKLVNFLINNKDFLGNPETAKKLQSIGDYVKIAILQYEEVYQQLDPSDVLEQANQLRGRLVREYAKAQKQKLAEKIKNTNIDSEITKLIGEVNKLNNLIK